MNKLEEQKSLNNELDLKKQRELRKKHNRDLFTANEESSLLSRIERSPCFDCEHCGFRKRNNDDRKITGYCQFYFESVFSSDNKNDIVTQCVEHDIALELQ